MAGHVDHFVAGRGVRERVEVVHGDAVVQLVPEHWRAGTTPSARPDASSRRRSPARSCCALAPGLGVADVFLAPRWPAIAARTGSAFSTASTTRAPVRKIRPDHRRADAVEMRAQHARELAHRRVRAIAAGLDHDARAATPAREKCTIVSRPFSSSASRRPEAADDRPSFPRTARENQPRVAVRRAADVDRHRHDLDVALGRGFQRAQQLAQRLVRRAVGGCARTSSRRAGSARTPSGADACRPAAASGWAARPRGRRVQGSACRRGRRARSRSTPARRRCSRLAGSAGSRRMRTHGSSSWPERLNHHGARLRGEESAIMFCISAF